jgi:hypothetical protein
VRSLKPSSSTVGFITSTHLPKICSDGVLTSPHFSQ